MTIRQDLFREQLSSPLTWRAVVWVTLPLLLVIAISALGLLVSYPVFHAMAELFSIAIALAALLVASTSQRFRKNDVLVYLGIVIGWCAVIDLWHTLTFKGMGLFPGDSANPPTQLWIAARYVQAFGMITAPLFLHRRVSVWLTHAGFGLAVAILLALIAYGVFPVAYIDGQGLTPFKIYSEYLIIVMLGMGLLLLWRSRALLPRQMLLGLTIATLAMMLSELAFTRYVSVFASANLVGHVFKIIAYWFIFIGLVEWALREPFELLSESAARYQRTVEGANDGIWEWIPSTNENYLSPRFKQLLGFADNELPNIGESFFDRIHAEDVERVHKAVDDHLQEHKPYAVDLRLKCKNGDYRWFYARGLAQWDAQGKPLRMSGSITDIGDLKRAQFELVEKVVALRERGKELRCLNDLLSLGYPDPLPLTELLTAAVRVLPQGWFFDDITCARIVFEDRVFTTDNFRETPWKLSADLLVAGRSAGSVDVFYLEERPAGDVGPFLNEEAKLTESIASQLGAKIGRLQADERLRNSEASLRTSEAKFRGIVEQSMVGVYMLDGDKLQYANPRAAEILGHAPTDLEGAPLLPLIADEDRPPVTKLIEAINQGKTDVGRFEYKVRRKDGAEVIVGTEVRRTELDGKPAIIGVLQDVTSRVRSEEKEREYTARLENAVLGTVGAVSYMMDLRDPYTAGHERRVGELSARIAAEMGLGENFQRGLRVAGGVHDVGKITVPAEILNKPGKLSAIEFEIIKSHAEQGYEVLKNVDFPWPVAEVARQHHERIDGSGYPRGLKGEEIILEARIMAVADVVEAMSTHRPYRPALGVDAALAEIERGRGTAFDPVVADACLRLFREKGYQLPGN